MLGAASRVGKGLFNFGRDALRGSEGLFDLGATAVFGGGMILGMTPFLGPALRERTGTFGEIAFHDPIGHTDPGSLLRGGMSRDLANQIQRSPKPVPVRGPTNRGLGYTGAPMKLDRYGNPTSQVKAAHAMKEKIAVNIGSLTPAKAIALGAAASAGGALGSSLLSGALNRLDSLRLEAGRQTNMNKTMRILNAVNPEVQDSPQMRARAKALYNVVHRTSPYVAREPIVAASVINTMISQATELPPVDQFKQLIELQKARGDSSGRRMVASVPVSPENMAGLLGVNTDG
jgi:hypothetical protein